MVTTTQLTTAIGGKLTKAQQSNMASMCSSLLAYGRGVGLGELHRLAQFLAQILHESGNFRYDREVWGPTKAQERYDTRTDLGNTPEKDGDGKKFAGRGPMQVTGKYNVTRFYQWCVAKGMNPPDFRKTPDLINTDPWEGLSAIWYWDVGNPTGKSLNVYADENNIIQITKKINGGLNGFDDRVRNYVRVALVLLGFEPTNVTGFQKQAQAAGLLPPDTAGKTQIDGDPGPITMAALHQSLARLSGDFAAKAAPVVEVKEVPVEVKVEVEKPVAVTTEAAQKPMPTWLAAGGGFISTNAGSFFTSDLTTKLLILGVSVAAFAFIIWRGQSIARKLKALIAEFG